jgi:exosortase
VQSAAQSITALPVSEPAGGRALIPGWAKIAVVAVAFCWLYSENLQRLWIKTNLYSGDRNWSHSMMIPLIGIYYLLLHRDELRVTPIRPLLGDRFTKARFISVAIAAAGGLLTWLVAPYVVPAMDSTIQPSAIVANLGLGVAIWAGLALVLDWGLGTLVAGLLLSAYGIYPGQNDFVWDVGMVVTLFGIVLTMCGWQVMRIAWFPIAFLLCALPWPPLVYSAIALPLQKIAAIGSVALMNIIGVEASHGGSKIFIAQFNPETGRQMEDRALNVAEACAGLVSLMTFISISAAIAFLSSRAMWQKLIITASAVPIAIFCNILRVAGVGLLDKYGGREWSDGFAHQFAGMVLLLPAFFIIMLVCWVVDQLVIEEADDEPAAEKVTPPTTTKPAGGAA